MTEGEKSFTLVYKYKFSFEILVQTHNNYLDLPLTECSSHGT